MRSKRKSSLNENNVNRCFQRTALTNDTFLRLPREMWVNFRDPLDTIFSPFVTSLFSIEFNFCLAEVIINPRIHSFKIFILFFHLAWCSVS